MDLTCRLVNFIIEIDPYEYRNGLDENETEQDMIDQYRELLKNPLLIRSAIDMLEEMMKNGTLDESDIEERKECKSLIEELSRLYRETVTVQSRKIAERSARWRRKSFLSMMRP